MCISQDASRGRCPRSTLFVVGVCNRENKLKKRPFRSLHVKTFNLCIVHKNSNQVLIER